MIATPPKPVTPAELHEWRLMRGFTQDELADVLGVNRVTYGRWELGQRRVPPMMRYALAGLDAELGRSGAILTPR